MPDDPIPGPLCVPLLLSASASAPAADSLPSRRRQHCFDPRRTRRPLLLYVYHPSDAFSRRAVAADALDLFLKELRPLREGAFDFVFAVAQQEQQQQQDDSGGDDARASALLARLEDAVGRLGAPRLDIGPVVGPDGEEAEPPARLRYAVVAPAAGSGDADADPQQRQPPPPWGWAPPVLAAWPDPNAMRLVRVWDGQQQEHEAKLAGAEEAGGAAAAAAAAAGGKQQEDGGAAKATTTTPPLLTATRLGSRFPWLLPGFQAHPDTEALNATLSYRLAAVGGGFVRRACSGAVGDGSGGGDPQEEAAAAAEEAASTPLGNPRDAVVLIPFAYGSSPEADGGCTYWHVLRAAQRELGAAGALFHAPLPGPQPSSSAAAAAAAAAGAAATPPPTAPGGLEEQLFQPSYVPWPGFDAPPFDEDADSGPEAGGAEIPAASVERATAAAIRAALAAAAAKARVGVGGGSDQQQFRPPRAGFLARPLPTGAAALAVDARGRLQEAGWLKLPSLEHAAWAARYLSWRERALEARLDALSAREREGDALVVPVIGFGGDASAAAAAAAAARPLSPDTGRVSAAVELPPASELARFSKVEADFALDCPGALDASCPQWDHVLQTFVCCSAAAEDTFPAAAAAASAASPWRRPACVASPSADCWGTRWRRAGGPAAADADDDDDAAAADASNGSGGGGNACGRELLRVVTPFRRRGGRWLVDVTALRGLLHPPSSPPGGAPGDGGRKKPASCAFHVQGPAWAGPWVPRLALRFSEPREPRRAPPPTPPPPAAAAAAAAVHVKALWPSAPPSFDVSESPPGGGGNCDTSGAHPPAPLPPPPPPGSPRRLRKATLVAAITGHGAAEFVPSSHAFYLDQRRGATGGRGGTLSRDLLLTADLASHRPGGVWGSGARGCVPSVDAGAVPNEHGTWLYTRSGWCDGAPADGPWVADVTERVREAWRREAGEAGTARAAVAFGCAFPSGGSGGAPEAPGGARLPFPARDKAGRRLLDEPNAAIMMEATLVLEYEDGGGEEEEEEEERAVVV